MPSSSTHPTKVAALARWMRAEDAPARLSHRIFWTGFLIRVLYLTLAHTYRFRPFDNHFEFGWEMGRIGRALATGQGFANPFNGHSGPTAWTPPLYPLLIGAVFKLFGVYTQKSGWVILTINSIFSAATSLAIYEIALRCFTRTPPVPEIGRDFSPGINGTESTWALAPGTCSPTAGPASHFASTHAATNARSIALWSAWLWALYPAAMQYAVRWIWDMSVTAFFFSCILVLALRLRNIGTPTTSNQQPTTRNWLLFGLFWGLIALSNSSLLTFLPAAGLWIIWPAFTQTRGAPSSSTVPSSTKVGSHSTPVALRNPGAPSSSTVPSSTKVGSDSTPVALRNPGAPSSSTVPSSTKVGSDSTPVALRNPGAPSSSTVPSSTKVGSDSTPGAPSVQPPRMGRIVEIFLGPILAALIFLAVITPWVVRNYRVFHAFIPMRSNFGAELYEATLFSTDGFPWGATLPMAENAPDFQRFERLGEVGYSREQGDIAKARIRAHRALFLANTLRRIYFFWITVPHTAGTSEFIEAIRRINFCFFSFTGILGLALALRRHIPGAWLFFWAFAICPFVYYFVTAQARFRHPLEPIICILSVYLFQSADRTRPLSPRKAPPRP